LFQLISHLCYLEAYTFGISWLLMMLTFIKIISEFLDTPFGLFFQIPQTLFEILFEN